MLVLVLPSNTNRSFIRRTWSCNTLCLWISTWLSLSPCF